MTFSAANLNSSIGVGSSDPVFGRAAQMVMNGLDARSAYQAASIAATMQVMHGSPASADFDKAPTAISGVSNSGGIQI